MAIDLTNNIFTAKGIKFARPTHRDQHVFNFLIEYRQLRLKARPGFLSIPVLEDLIKKAKHAFGTDSTKVVLEGIKEVEKEIATAARDSLVLSPFYYFTDHPIKPKAEIKPEDPIHHPV